MKLFISVLAALWIYTPAYASGIQEIGDISSAPRALCSESLSLSTNGRTITDSYPNLTYSNRPESFPLFRDHIKDLVAHYFGDISLVVVFNGLVMTAKYFSLSPPVSAVPESPEYNISPNIEDRRIEISLMSPKTHNTQAMLHLACQLVN